MIRPTEVGLMKIEAVRRLWARARALLRAFAVKSAAQYLVGGALALDDLRGLEALDGQVVLAGVRAVGLRVTLQLH